MYIELSQDILDMGTEGISRHAKMPGDLILLHPLGQAAEYLFLPFTQGGQALIKAAGVMLG
jgi:hypothetical protein